MVSPWFMFPSPLCMIFILAVILSSRSMTEPKVLMKTMGRFVLPIFTSRLFVGG